MTRDVADVVVIGADRILLVEKAGIAASGTDWSSAPIRQHDTHEILARMAPESSRVFERFAEVVGTDAAVPDGTLG